MADPEMFPRGNQGAASRRTGRRGDGECCQAASAQRGKELMPFNQSPE